MKGPNKEPYGVENRLVFFTYEKAK